MLRAVAIPSNGSTDRTGSKGKTHLRVSVVELTWQPCPSKAPVFMHGGEFPPKSILGNSELLATVAALGQALLVNLQLRFPIPNAHERTRASFSTVLRSRVSATRTKKSTGI